MYGGGIQRVEKRMVGACVWNLRMRLGVVVGQVLRRRRDIRSRRKEVLRAVVRRVSRVACMRGRKGLGKKLSMHVVR